jgi:hypothetical protein
MPHFISSFDVQNEAILGIAPGRARRLHLRSPAS